MRALLTDRDREVLETGRRNVDVSEKYYYKVRRQIRNRLDRLDGDLDVLQEKYPEQYNRLVEIVEEHEARSEEVADTNDVVDEEDVHLTAD